MEEKRIENREESEREGRYVEENVLGIQRCIISIRKAGEEEIIEHNTDAIYIHLLCIVSRLHFWCL